MFQSPVSNYSIYRKFSKLESVSLRVEHTIESYLSRLNASKKSFSLSFASALAVYIATLSP
jgi:hypothetical protein